MFVLSCVPICHIAWVPPPATPPPARARTGVCSYGSQLCMTFSLRHAAAAPALAMSYLSIVVGLARQYGATICIRFFTLD